MRVLFALFLASLCPLAALAVPITISGLSVPGNALWFDTGINLDAAELVTLSASGTVYACEPAGPQCAVASPDGWSPGTPRPQNLAPNLVAYSLIGRIGASGNPFFVGTNFEGVVPLPGRLFLTINDELDAFGDNSGFWLVEGSVAAVPEPSTMTLLAGGLAGLALARRSSKAC